MKFYTAINSFDGNDTFEISGNSLEEALTKALEQLGWMVCENSFEDYMDMYPIGTVVNVDEGDKIFTGRVVGYKNPYIQVEDEDGIVSDLDVNSISFNSDEYMS